MRIIFGLLQFLEEIVRIPTKKQNGKEKLEV